MTKSAFIAIVGKPNVGKSTLLNALINKKVAIVSPKVQTTRYNITGVLTEGDNQFVFIDTPGMHKPIHQLGSIMDKGAENTLYDADVVCWVVDRPFHQSDERVLKRIEKSGLPVILVINKIDKLESKTHIDEIILSFIHRYDFKEVIPISALNQTHIDKLKEALTQYLIEGPHYFPDDEVTDQNDERRMAELIREKILYHTEEEVPHSVAVFIEQLEQNKELNTIDVNAVIIVERDSQKGILIGKNGERLKRIGTEARKDINRILNMKIHLTLWVKVKENWRNDPGSIERYGYGK